MTLAGTRPPTVDEWDKYELHHRARLATKPGLTGMWQVSGRSNITDFNKIVFIIRKDIKDAFKEAIGDRIEKICKDLDVTDAAWCHEHDISPSCFYNAVSRLRKSTWKMLSSVGIAGNPLF